MKIEKEQIVQSKWSSDEATLKRLSVSLNSANYFSRIARTRINIDALKQWRASLDIAWGETEPKALKNEIKKIKETIDNFKKLPKLIEYVGLRNNETKIINSKNYNIYIQLVSEYSRIIRRIADSHNMLLSDKKTNEYSEEWW